MSKEDVLVVSWWTRLKQSLGLKKPKVTEVKPEQYCTEKVLAMAKRVAMKTTTWEMGPEHIGMLIVERLPVDGQGIIPAEQLQFVKRWTESTEQDPIMILFLLDCPEWNNQYPVTDFDKHLSWLFENDQAQLEAFKKWKQALLR